MRQKLPPLAALALLLLSACGGATGPGGVLSRPAGSDIKSLDVEVREISAAHRSARASRDEAALRQTELRFREVARRAQTLARSEAPSLNQVAFYRIAAIAGWQGNAPELLEVSQAGQDSCRALPQGAAAAPRDCGLLMVAPLLAASDQRVGEIEALQRRRAAAGGRLDAKDVAATTTLLGNSAGLYERFHRQQVEILRLDAPAAFKQAIADQGARMACNVQAAFALVVSAAGIPSAPVTQARPQLERVEALHGEGGRRLTCPHVAGGDLVTAGTT